MKLGLITYNSQHLKTEQIIRGFSINGVFDRHNIEVYALPFVHRQQRKVLFEHRPFQFVGPHITDLCKLYDLTLTEVESDIHIDNSCDMYIILGAGILSPECVQGKKILNSHPGIIPTSRGLDAFKWSVYYNRPMGNALHFIDEETDKGKVILIKNTPIYYSDTIEEFAKRHYENELNIMLNFEHFLNNDAILTCHAEEMPATRRMPIDTEREMLLNYSAYKNLFAIGNAKNNML